MKDPSTDETEVEIDLGEIDWSALPEALAHASVEAVEVRPPVEEARPPVEEAATPAPPQSTRPETSEEPGRPKQPGPPRQPGRSGRAEQPTRPAQPFHAPFAEIVARVEPASVRALIGSTFARLLRVLDTLGVIEKALSRPQAVKVAFLFEEVRAQTASLLAQVTAAVSHDAALDPRLREALDGMRFVIGHEMSKVFRQEFPGINADARREYTRADLSRAWGLLHNCLQQTAITLAQEFEPGVTGEQLFEDYRCKVENSFTLYAELAGLLRKTRAAEKSNGILLKHTLVRHLEHFRDETMHFLMYKDWGEFGRYVDEVKRAFEEMEEFEAVLHEFSQYLGTLIHHVGMREVLRGAAPPPSLLGADDDADG